MKLFSFKKLIPAVIVPLAIGSAVANAPKNLGTPPTNVIGYIKNNPVGTSCTEGGICSDVVGVLCTVNNIVGGTQLWGKDSQGKCNREVYRVPN